MSIVVKATKGESSDALIRRFQKKVIMEDVIKEYRELAFHKKNSEKRQERLAEKRRKIMRAKRYAE